MTKTTKTMLFKFKNERDKDGGMMYIQHGRKKTYTITVANDRSSLTIYDKAGRAAILLKEKDSDYSNSIVVGGVKVEAKAHLASFTILLVVIIIK